jgi:hypothetical protein
MCVDNWTLCENKLLMLTNEPFQKVFISCIHQLTSAILNPFLKLD